MSDENLVSSEDRITPANPVSKFSRWLAAVILLLLLGGLAYYFYVVGPDWRAGDQAREFDEIATRGLVQPEDLSPAPAAESAPPIPERAPAEPSRPALPDLEAADEFIRQNSEQFDLPKPIAKWHAGEHLLPRGVTFIDGLARGAILRKITPLDKTPELRPTGKFKVRQEAGDMLLDTANFQRYRGFVDTLTAIDTGHLAELFHWLRPLLEQAYTQLGQPKDQFGNRVTKAIDMLLATPEADYPLKLKRDTVYYQYADPQLEALPPVQKQLLRMGPKNTATIKAWLRALRAALIGAEDGEAGTEAD